VEPATATAPEAELTQPAPAVVRGTVQPADFIPVAEESGLIEPIGRWVLEHACRQAAKWYHARPDAAPLSMSVNLSAVQLENRSLADVVATTLRGCSLDPGCLSLEITESVMLGQSDGLSDALEFAQGDRRAAGA